MAVKSKKSDRAITDYVLADKFDWTFEDIDNADAERLNELFIVIETVQKIQDAESKKRKRNASRRGTGGRRRRR